MAFTPEQHRLGGLASAAVRRQRGKRITPIGDKRFSGPKLKVTGRSLTRRVPLGINKKGQTVYSRVPKNPNRGYKKQRISNKMQSTFIPSGRFTNLVGRYGWKKRIKNTIKLGG